MKKFIAGFGELMLRLSPEGKHRLCQVLPGSLSATFGGAEANVCASVAALGGSALFLSRLPQNPVGLAALFQLRALGVETSRVYVDQRRRLGLYYTESGSNQRGSKVYYDRQGSAFALAKADDYDFDMMLHDVSIMHLSGITPALSRNAFQVSIALLAEAQKRGVMVSCDLNFRRQLWGWEPGLDANQLAEECMAGILPYCSILVANESDAYEVFSMGEAVDGMIEEADSYLEVAAKLAQRFPDLKKIALTLRENISADHNLWSGMLYDCEQAQAYWAPLDKKGNYAPYQIAHVVDRFGGGDAFCAGLLFALQQQEYSEPSRALAFATAASCLKHSICGDYNYSFLDEVEALLQGDVSGRVQR